MILTKNVLQKFFFICVWYFLFAGWFILITIRNGKESCFFFFYFLRIKRKPEEFSLEIFFHWNLLLQQKQVCIQAFISFYWTICIIKYTARKQNNAWETKFMVKHTEGELKILKFLRRNSITKRNDEYFQTYDVNYYFFNVWFHAIHSCSLFSSLKLLFLHEKFKKSHHCSFNLLLKIN